MFLMLYFFSSAHSTLLLSRPKARTLINGYAISKQTACRLIQDQYTNLKGVETNNVCSILVFYKHQNPFIFSQLLFDLFFIAPTYSMCSKFMLLFVWLKDNNKKTKMIVMIVNKMLLGVPSFILYSY